MTTLAIYSNKGGVGKTAAAVNLSYLAAQTGAKTLLCDLDPQSSATYYFRIKPKLRSGAKGFIHCKMPIMQTLHGGQGRYGKKRFRLFMAVISMRIRGSYCSLDITLMMMLIDYYVGLLN